MNRYKKYLKPIRLVFPLLMFVLLMSCNNLKDLEMRVAKLETEVAALKRGGVSSSTASALYPKFQFVEEEYNFGEIKDGAIVGHTFRFSNVGEAPLIISKATAACGCTVPAWPKEPIPPGGSGEIQVQFDSSNKPGIQNKVVTITSNTQEKVKKLLIKAQVVGK